MKKSKDNNVETLKRCFKEVFNNKFILILIIFCFIVTAVLSTAAPKLIGNIMTEICNELINKVATSEPMNFRHINSLLIFLCILYVINAIIEYMKNVLVVDTCQNYVGKLRERINVKISDLPIRYFDNKNNGQIMSLLINDIENISVNLPSILRNIFTEILLIVGATIMLFTFSPMLLFVILIISVISVAICLVCYKKSEHYFVDKQKKISDINEILEESYTGHSEIQIFEQTEKINNNFRFENRKLKNINMKSRFIASLAGSAMIFMENLTLAIVIIISTILNLKKVIQIGDIYTVISYTQTMTNPLKNLADKLNEFLSILVSARRVYDFIDEKEEIKKDVIVKRLEKNINADSVEFGYEPDSLVLKDVNAIFQKGKKVAIVGKTGSGKTTLAKLILNTYNVCNGKITYDDTSLNVVNNEEYIKNFSLINQDINLFADTVMENIKYGNPDITDEEVISIAKRLNLHEKIENLKDGYNTLISENSNISSGMKQLIIFMQNAVSNSSIFVFDEATNMLDDDTEGIINYAVNQIRKDKALIVIAHKLHSIKDSDYIYVMKDGRIVEEGTHDELIKNQSVYEKMYNASI